MDDGETNENSAPADAIRDRMVIQLSESREALHKTQWSIVTRTGKRFKSPVEPATTRPPNFFFFTVVAVVMILLLPLINHNH